MTDQRNMGQTASRTSALLERLVVAAGDRLVPLLIAVAVDRALLAAGRHHGPA